MNDFPQRLVALRKALGLTQQGMADRMGLSMSYVHQLEVGKRTASDAVETLVRMLEHQLSAGMIEPGAVTAGRNLDQEAKAGDSRMIPVVGWAHAGEAASYDEMPLGWQDSVPTECRDPKAFAVRLEGDSMEPKFSEGDLLIVQPGEEIYGGCLAILKLANDGIIFRRVEKRGDLYRLVPLNTLYGVEELARESVVWIYPVWGMWRQLWRR